MTTVIRITGKARHVSKLISLFAIYRGEDTIGKIVEEKKQSVVLLSCRESQSSAPLTKLQVMSRYRGTCEFQMSHNRCQKILP
jgi:hypothetical protein